MTANVGTSPSSKLTRYEEGLQKSILAFQREAYPHRREDWIAPRWRWMFLNSARRLGLDPMVWVYRDESRILAHQGVIPVRLQVGEEQHRTGWFVETMALESVRGRTAGPAVIMKAKQELPFNLSLGQTEPMRNLQFRLGWQQVAPLPTYVLPLNPNRILAQKLPSRGLRPLASLGLHAIQRAKRTASTAGRRIGALDVKTVERFGERHDRLWEEARKDLVCSVVRDTSYLNWKYIEQPGQDFLPLEIIDDHGVRAVAVLSLSEPNSVYRYRRAYLVDLVAPLSDRTAVAAAFEAARHAALERDVDLLAFDVINRRLQRMAKRYGFLEREPTRFLLISPEGLAETTQRVVLGAENWYITRGDSDIDRPW